MQVRNIVVGVEAVVEQDATHLEPTGDCQICWHAYTSTARRPLALHCGHTLCLRCLENLPSLHCPGCSEDMRYVVVLQQS